LTKIYWVTQNDPLAKFPVSRPHKKSILKWIEKNFSGNSIPVPKEIEIGIESIEDLTEPEYIFKTFDRGDSVFVTLLEENREMIGHGTTGEYNVYIFLMIQRTPLNMITLVRLTRLK
jgi:hypothetical protein